MNYTKSETNVLVADSFKELNYKQKRLLLEAVSAKSDSQKYISELIKICGEGVYNKIEQNFCDTEYRDKVVADIQKKGITAVTNKSASYPEQLSYLPVPPLAIYCKGNAKLLGEKCFAIVGSRKTTAPVIEECKRISRALSSHFAVVTGVADGADCAAARGALDTGNVICVLPGGHGSSCSANWQLIRQVEQSGLTISEFPPATPAFRYNFTLRNRIIAGLACGVLVTSAGEKSGALSTAAYAFEYGKQVFAFPYSLGVTSGVGCNALIKKGATLCDRVEDILSEYGLSVDSQDEVELGEDEKTVLSVLKAQGETHAEQLAKCVNMRLADVLIICSMLEIKGLCVRVGGNKFSAV